VSDHELLVALETLGEMYEVSQRHQVGAGVDSLVRPFGDFLFEYAQVPRLAPRDSFPGFTVHQVDHSSRLSMTFVYCGNLDKPTRLRRMQYGQLFAAL
jgi:hypothetical protein